MKTGYKGEWRTNTFTSCCTLKEVRSGLGLPVQWRKLQMGRTVNHPLRAISGPSGNHLACCPLRYPIWAPPFIRSVPQDSKFIRRLTYSQWDAMRCSSLTAICLFFPAGSIISSDSRPSLGCKVSILPVALQRYFFLQSCFILAPGKMIRPFLSEVRKGCNKVWRSRFSYQAGEMLEVALVVWSCTEIEWFHWI